VIILVGVFICALNFIKVESSEPAEGKTEAKTEMTTPAANGAKPAASETATPASDTTHTEKH
jgi:hypothetical protein